MKLKGIDVSEHQGIIDWITVKSQIDFAILRIGYGDNVISQDDAQWTRNAKECTRLGIPFGVYIYSYATTIEQAKSEAQHVLRLIKGYKLDYPIYFDLEDEGTTGTRDNNTIEAIAKAFCDIIESAGYFVGIYANTYWLNSRLTSTVFDKWDKWVAEYNSNCNYGGNYETWQYTDKEYFNGINGPVDTNICYVDYPGIIKSAGLNGYRKESINNVKVEYDMTKIVVYTGDLDSLSAIVVGQRHKCPVMKLDDFKSSGIKAKEIIQIGGKTGSNRYTSFKDAGNLV